MKLKEIIFLLCFYLLMPQLHAQWQLVMRKGGNIYSIVKQNNQIYAGTLLGIFKSGDGGKTWIEKNNGLTNKLVHPILINGTRLLTGTEAGVFISDDEGNNWKESNQGMIISKIKSLYLID